MGANVAGRTKWVVRFTGVLVALMLLGLAWEYFENSRKVNEAKSLLDAFSSLQVGKSTLEDIDVFVSHNGVETRSVQIGGACRQAPDAQVRATLVQSHVLNWLGMRNGTLRIFGNTVWMLGLSSWSKMETCATPNTSFVLSRKATA
jgi:hypothetical protein